MINEGDLVAILEIARVGIAMAQDEIADELDIPDNEMCRLRDLIQEELA